MKTPDVKTAAHEAGNSTVVERGARLGYAVSGLLHLLIAYIALKVAWTSGGGKADQSGALATLAGSTGGSFVLWLTVVGLVLLAVWQAHRGDHRRPRSRGGRPGQGGGQGSWSTPHWPGPP